MGENPSMAIQWQLFFHLLCLYINICANSLSYVEKRTQNLETENLNHGPCSTIDLEYIT